MTAIITYSATERVLADMFTENTGRHLLDSGGAYGRSWERNRAAVEAAGMSAVEYFMERPEAWIDRWNCVTVDAFHFLRQRLSFDEDARRLDHAYRLFVYLDDDRYLNSYGTAEEFVDALTEKGWADRSDEWNGSGGLTYNSENALSQDFHWVGVQIVEGNGLGIVAGTYVGINIHGGCDVRGGYTDFRWFFLDGYDATCSLLDFGSYDVVYGCDGSHDHDQNQLTLDGSTPFACPYGPNRGDSVVMSSRGGYPEWYWGGDYGSDAPDALTDADDDRDGYVGPTRYRCECGGVLTVTGVCAPCPY